MQPEYKYEAEVVNVIDGDTIDVIIDLGFGISFGNKKAPQRLRIADIDTPEMNDPDADTRSKAQAAKAFVQSALIGNDGEVKKIVVVTRKTKAGKEYQTFGRWVADVFYPHAGGWADLAKMLVLEGLAVRV